MPAVLARFRFGPASVSGQQPLIAENGSLVGVMTDAKAERIEQAQRQRDSSPKTGWKTTATSTDQPGAASRWPQDEGKLMGF